MKSRIFSEEVVAITKVKPVKRSTKRLRDFWWKVVENRRCYCSAIISDVKNFDLRPFATVRIFNEDVLGMIDTGATISCFGSDYAIRFLEKNESKWDKFNILLKTADGSNHCAVGKVTTKVTFRGQTKTIQFVIIPKLSQNLYLGVDFVHSFGLAKDLFIENNNCNQLNVNEIKLGDDKHSLTEEQENRLGIAINSLPSFSKEGLGRTAQVSHVIETGEYRPIKQRHFAVSPAVEKLLFAKSIECYS